MGDTIRSTQMAAYKGEAKQRLLRHKERFLATQKREPPASRTPMTMQPRQRMVGG